MLKALTHEEQKRRAELLVATKEKRILEKLKEKQFKAEEKERDVLETKAADELSLTAFARTRV
ncbi:Flagellar FliJ protein [compost metagenome]